MQLLIIFFASLIPGLFWVWFFRRKDLYEREPWNLVLATFLFGAIAVIPAALFEFPFRQLLHEEAGLLGRFLISFLVIGLGEEFFKFAALYLAAYRSAEFNEVVDGIIYGITAGIGFSVVENLLYTTTFGLEIAPIRAVIATLAHASFSGILGYYVGLAKFSETPFSLMASGVVIAAFFHGLYDFILLAEVVSPLIAIAMVGLLYYILLRLIDQALAVSPFRQD